MPAREPEGEWTYGNVAADVALDRAEGSRLEVIEDDDQSLASLNELAGVDVGAIDWHISEGSLVVRVLEEGRKRSHFGCGFVDCLLFGDVVDGSFAR